MWLFFFSLLFAQSEYKNSQWNKLHTNAVGGSNQKTSTKRRRKKMSKYSVSATKCWKILTAADDANTKQKHSYCWQNEKKGNIQIEAVLYQISYKWWMRSSFFLAACNTAPYVNRICNGVTKLKRFYKVSASKCLLAMESLSSPFDAAN